MANKQEEKTLDVTNVDEAKQKVSDIKVVGNGNTFAVISKASSEKQGWMKSTKGMQTPTGVVIQVTTQQKNPDGSYAVAEALVFVPDAKLVPDEEHEGVQKLAPLHN